MEAKKVDCSLKLFGKNISTNHIQESHPKKINESWNFHGVNKYASASRNHTFHAAVPVYNPLPLRCFHEKIGFFSGEYFRRFHEYSHIDHDHRNGVKISGTDHPNPPSVSEIAPAHKKSQMKNKKRENVSTDDHEETKRIRKGKFILPEEEEITMSETGTKIMPVLLYEKKLEDSDVRTDQNMLVINRSLKLMYFLNKEENNAVVNSREGLEFSAVDAMGRSYELRMKLCLSLMSMVITSKGWSRIILQNNVKKDDCVQLWGYRRRGEFCLAFSFRKAEEDVASTSSNNVNGGIVIID